MLKFVKRDPGASQLRFARTEHLDVFDEENNKLTSINLHAWLTASFSYEGTRYEISHVKTGFLTGKWVITANAQPFGEFKFPSWTWKKPKLLLLGEEEPWTFTLRSKGQRRNLGELIRNNGQVLYHTSHNKIPATNLYGYDVSIGEIESHDATILIQILGLYMNNRLIFLEDHA